MKLLVCATEYYPHGSGIANVAYNVVEKLKEKGIDCTICSPTGPDIEVGTSRPLGIIGLIYYWHQVAQYFKENSSYEFDAVWLHNPLFIEKFPFDNKCLATMNATNYGQANNKMYPLHLHMYKIFCSKIEQYCIDKMKAKSFFTGVGTNVCKELECMGVDQKRIFFIPNGVDTKKFKTQSTKEKIRKKYSIPENHLILLSVGRLTEQKNPFKLIDVFSHINKSIHNSTLVLAGRGELADKVKTYIDEKGVNNVILLGYVEEDNKPDLYACSDYFIMTSRYEGGEPPLTLSEAMASGLPCIVSNISNFNVVKDADCGIIMDFKDLQRTGNEVVGYLERDNSEHSINARKYAEVNLDWDKITEEYLYYFYRFKNNK
jgi:glycosyltransferase involved in cell wall biosynthesis